MSNKTCYCGVKAIYGGRCIRHTDQICVICQEHVATRNTFSTRRLKCGHAYHTTCLMNWLVAHDSCPTCREDLEYMDIVHFKRNVEDNLRIKYKDAIDSLELEINWLRATIEMQRNWKR